MANREGLSPFFPQGVAAARKKYIFPLYLLVLRVPFFSYSTTATCNQTNIAVNQSFDPFWSAIHENTSNPSNEGKMYSMLVSIFTDTKCREWFSLSRLWYVYLYNQTDNQTFCKLFPYVKHFQKENFSFFWNFTIKIRRIGSSWKSFFWIHKYLALRAQQWPWSWEFKCCFFISACFACIPKT